MSSTLRRSRRHGSVTASIGPSDGSKNDNRLFGNSSKKDVFSLFATRQAMIASVSTARHKRCIPTWASVHDDAAAITSTNDFRSKTIISPNDNDDVAAAAATALNPSITMSLREEEGWLRTRTYHSIVAQWEQGLEKAMEAAIDLVNGDRDKNDKTTRNMMTTSSTGSILSSTLNNNGTISKLNALKDSGIDQEKSQCDDAWRELYQDFVFYNDNADDVNGNGGLHDRDFTNNSTTKRDDDDVEDVDVINQLALPVSIWQGPYHVVDRHMWMRLLIQQRRQLHNDKSCIVWLPDTCPWPAHSLVYFWKHEIVRQCILQQQQDSHNDILSPSLVAGTFNNNNNSNNSKYGSLSERLRTWAAQTTTDFDSIVVCIHLTTAMTTGSHASVSHLLQWMAERRAYDGIPLESMLMVPTTSSSSSICSKVIWPMSRSLFSGGPYGMRVRYGILPNNSTVMEAFWQGLQATQTAAIDVKHGGHPNGTDSAPMAPLRWLLMVRTGSIANTDISFIASLIARQQHESFALQFLEWKQALARVLAVPGSFIGFDDCLHRSRAEHDRINWFLMHSTGQQIIQSARSRYGQYHPCSASRLGTNTSFLEKQRSKKKKRSYDSAFPPAPASDTKNDTTNSWRKQWQLHNRMLSIVLQVQQLLRQQPAGDVVNYHRSIDVDNDSCSLWWMPTSCVPRSMLLGTATYSQQQQSQQSPMTMKERLDLIKCLATAAVNIHSSSADDDDGDDEDLRWLDWINELIILVDHCTYRYEVEACMYPSYLCWRQLLLQLLLRTEGNGNIQNKSNHKDESLELQRSGMEADTGLDLLVAQPRRHIVMAMNDATSMEALHDLEEETITNVVPVNTGIWLSSLVSMASVPGIMYRLLQDSFRISQKDWFEQWVEHVYSLQQQQQPQTQVVDSEHPKSATGAALSADQVQHLWNYFACGVHELKVIGLIQARRMMTGGGRLNNNNNTIIYEKTAVVWCSQ